MAFARVDGTLVWKTRLPAHPAGLRVPGLEGERPAGEVQLRAVRRVGGSGWVLLREAAHGAGQSCWGLQLHWAVLPPTHLASVTAWRRGGLRVVTPHPAVFFTHLSTLRIPKPLQFKTRIRHIRGISSSTPEIYPVYEERRRLSAVDTAVPQILREDAVRRQCPTGTAYIVQGRARRYLHLRSDEVLLLT